jgi:hypothetical protein
MLQSGAVIFFERFHRFFRGRDSMDRDTQENHRAALFFGPGLYSPPVCSIISW